MELRWDLTGWRRLLIQYDCYAYKKERLDTDITHTRRMPCEHQGRNEVMQLQAKGHQKVSANHQEPQERSGTDVPDSSQKEPPRRYLISNIPPPELWNNKFLLLNYSVCSTLLQEPSKLKHSYFILFYLLIFGSPGSSLLCAGFLWLQKVEATLVSVLQFLIVVASHGAQFSGRGVFGSCSSRA